MGNLIHFILHIDEQLQILITQYGFLAHGFLFAILFVETGVVVMPFLPGDSLLFAAGLFAHPGKGFSLPLLLFGLPFAAVLGDTVNFHCGKFFGKRFLFKAKFFNPHWLTRTQAFYKNHGSKTIIMGRFVPIVRTVAPFVAGMDAMPFREYLPKCILGSFLWVWICVGAGYLLGEIPWVHENFEKVILGVILLSLVAIVKEVIKEKRAAKSSPVSESEESEKADLNTAT